MKFQILAERSVIYCDLKIFPIEISQTQLYLSILSIKEMLRKFSLRASSQELARLGSARFIPTSHKNHFESIFHTLLKQPEVTDFL